MKVATRESGDCSLYSGSGYAYRSPVYCFSVYVEVSETPAGLELLSNLEPLYATHLLKDEPHATVAKCRHVSHE